MKTDESKLKLYSRFINILFSIYLVECEIITATRLV